MVLDKRFGESFTQLDVEILRESLNFSRIYFNPLSNLLSSLYLEKMQRSACIIFPRFSTFPIFLFPGSIFRVSII